MLLNNKARAISFSGITLAFNSLIFALINIIPMNTVSLLLIASFLPSIIVLEFGLGYASIYTLSSIFLSFFIITNKIHFLTYLCLFSAYALVKALIENNIKKIINQLVFKLLYATIASILLYLVSKIFISNKIILPDNLSFIIYTLLIAGSLIAFLAYDYFFSLFIKYYKKIIKNKITKK